MMTTHETQDLMDTLKAIEWLRQEAKIKWGTEDEIGYLGYDTNIVLPAWQLHLFSLFVNTPEQTLEDLDKDHIGCKGRITHG